MRCDQKLASSLMVLALSGACHRDESHKTERKPAQDQHVESGGAGGEGQDEGGGAAGEAGDEAEVHDDGRTEIADLPASDTASGRGIRALLSEVPSDHGDASELTLTVTGEDIVAYRAKFGAAAEVDCAEEAGYGEERSVTTPLVLRQDGIPGGGVALCLVGRRDTAWQRFADATRVEWQLTRAGLSDFSIADVTVPGVYGEPFEISWSPASQAQRYHVVLARSGDDCRRPALTLPAEAATAVEIKDRLPHGRYIVCVDAIDSRGNVGRAANSGQVSFDTPPVVNLIYFVSSATGDRLLRHAVRSGDAAPWSDVEVPLPSPSSGFQGMASLQLGAQDDMPRIVYHVVERGILGPKSSVIGLATLGARGFAHLALATLTDLTASRLVSPFALDVDGRTELLLATAGSSANQILHIRGAPGSEAGSVAVASHEAGKIYQDASLVVDTQDRFHAAFVVDDQLRFFSSDTAAASWSSEREVNGEGCQSVTFATLAASSSDAIGVAYLCTRVTASGSSCELRFGRRDASGAWPTVTVATVAEQASCLPFSSSKPALALGSDGRAYIGYRYTVAGRLAEYDVAIATLAQDNTIENRQKMEEWSPLTGDARVSLDASGRVHIAYIGPDGIRLAWGEAKGDLKRETVVPQPEAASLELADFAVAGGTTRNAHQGQGGAQ